MTSLPVLALLALAGLAAGRILPDDEKHVPADKEAGLVKRQQIPQISEIVGGSDINPPNSWPFLVQLGRSGNSQFQSTFCGGAIIAESWILTAAHCFFGQSNFNNYRVTAGEHNIRVTEGLEQRRRIVEAILHPDYNDRSLNNDVCLLRLENPLNLTADGVRAINLNSDANCPADQQVCEVAGWGTTRSGGSTANIGQEVQVPAVTNSQCSDSYSGITDGMVCAGEAAGGKDSCQGDSGGPFVCSCGGEQRRHVGVVSFGRGCALPGFPGVYARTSFYKEWIESVVGDLCE